MDTGLFFPLDDEESTQVREAIRADGFQDTPEGRRSWLLARIRTSTRKPDLATLAAQFAKSPEARALASVASKLIFKRPT